jgi:hypothetical protein
VKFNYWIEGMMNINDKVRFNARSTAHIRYMTRREGRTSAMPFNANNNNNGIYQNFNRSGQFLRRLGKLK